MASLVVQAVNAPGTRPVPHALQAVNAPGTRPVPHALPSVPRPLVKSARNGEFARFRRVLQPDGSRWKFATVVDRPDRREW